MQASAISGKRLTRGALWIIAAFACVTLLCYPRIATSMFAMWAIDAAVYIAFLFAMKYCGMRTAVVAGLLTPLYAYVIRCLDGYAVPVRVLTNVALIATMQLLIRRRSGALARALLPTAVAFVAATAGTALTNMLVKNYAPMMALRVAVQIEVVPALSLLTACVTRNLTRLIKLVRRDGGGWSS